MGVAAVIFKNGFRFLDKWTHSETPVFPSQRWENENGTSRRDGPRLAGSSLMADPPLATWSPT